MKRAAGIADIRRRWPWLFLILPLLGTGLDYATGHVLSGTAFRMAFQKAIEPAIRESEDRMVTRMKKEFSTQLEEKFDEARLCREPRRWSRRDDR